MREGMRMDDQGVTLGDRDFKRYSQEAMRQIELLTKKTGGSDPVKLSVEDRVDAIEGAFRPILAVLGCFTQKHARTLSDKLWHRYLFPFGTYIFEMSNASTSKTEALFKETLMQPRKNASKGTYYMNPFSVCMADILYLCNTEGYLERFMAILWIILWAKGNGVNLLRHHRKSKSRPDASRLDQFFTLEKHLHLFGSIWLHRHVMQCNQIEVGGNWEVAMNKLNMLEDQLLIAFGVKNKQPFIHSRVKYMTMCRINSVGTINAFFQQAGKLSDAN